MNEHMTLEEIAKALQDKRASVVAEKTGLHINTIDRIKKGTEKNPKYQTIIVLSNYLRGK